MTMESNPSPWLASNWLCSACGTRNLRYRVLSAEDGVEDVEYDCCLCGENMVLDGLMREVK